MTRKLLYLPVLVLAVAGCNCESARKSALTAHEKEIDSIMAEMTLEEKVAMLHGKHMFSSAGVGRLGIADIEYADGPFGIREELEPDSWTPLHMETDSATFFPTGSALAATWSPELAREYGKGMAIEARLRGKDMILGPAINIQRIPTGGRTYEYLSEDPYLSGLLAVGYTLGAQENGAAVCLKHYALNNQETARGTVDVKVSERAMREIYLTPFEMAVKQADAWGVMAAYNKVEGKWCSENSVLLNDILRGEWGFKGMVISDWGGTHSTGAVEAGLNVEMPGGAFLGDSLLVAVKDGRVSEEAVDERVREILRVRMTVKPVPEEMANKTMTSQPNAQKIAYDVALRSVVLLKNSGLLPLDLQKYGKIAVIGDNAVCPQATGGFGAGVKALYEINPLRGLMSRIYDKAEVEYVPGYRRYGPMDRFMRKSPVCDPDPEMMAEAVRLAEASDLVIFFAGENREIETESSDRKSMTLPLGQDEILRAVSEVNPNVVTVVVAGAPVDLRNVEKLSSAVVVSWYNGSEGGNALADILTGKVSPSGKLPFTIPEKLEDSPAFSLGVFPRYDEAPYSEGIFVGYRWYDKKNLPVMYPFGHGLSYSSFEYSDISVRSSGKGIKLSFQIQNTGDMAAEEVAQVYVERPESMQEMPVRELKGFERVSLAPGESRKVEMFIDRESLRVWDSVHSCWTVESGRVNIGIGSSSRDIRLNATTTIK